MTSGKRFLNANFIYVLDLRRSLCDQTAALSDCHSASFNLLASVCTALSAAVNNPENGEQPLLVPATAHTLTHCLVCPSTFTLRVWLAHS